MGAILRWVDERRHTEVVASWLLASLGLQCGTFAHRFVWRANTALRLKDPAILSSHTHADYFVFLEDLSCSAVFVWCGVLHNAVKW